MIVDMERHCDSYWVKHTDSVRVSDLTKHHISCAQFHPLAQPC